MELETLQRPGNYLDGAFRIPAQAEGELVIRSPADSTDVCSVQPYARAALHEALEAARKAWPS